MTEVKFYHNAPDRLRAACVITSKAVAQGHRLVVFAPDDTTARAYDEQLWTFQPGSFVPHVRANSPLAARTPVLITRSLTDLACSDALLNLAPDLPPEFSSFGMLIEIVGQAEADRAMARQRWRQYKALDLPVTAHDLGRSAS
ncbi:MAG: hypothetical protein BSR46_00350 [Candidatus Dactylopiibacterium carminicum]|uniref:DNA polymerase III subunit chi n=1 Tax=Candidatus Dactylopiibacterium carminicum TaxID=857335 RepID=UPI000BDD7AB4|nr:DNA polymerase III subunit chi [Candidatus Dactylopiibacterium carminicum]PAT00843.1 MAG: hypothetical protein BSR46_00350 [Candidatus Dactylopiibacterium carminicum]